MKRIDIVVGTRPNFIKIAILIHKLKKFFNVRLIHTGQHYDYHMNKIFFEQLSIPQPDFFLNVKEKDYPYQTAMIIEKYTDILQSSKPNIIIVVGDVNSTMAAAITAKQNKILLAHIEAGLRSFDDNMPEELNRIITDRIADILFTPSPDAETNLINEGIKREKIFPVGNIMIDALVRFSEQLENNDILKKMNLKSGKYALITLHRPSNVDNKEKLEKILRVLNKMSYKIKSVFPIHPRTKRMLKKFDLYSKIEKTIFIIEPLSYFDLVKLQKNAKFVLTDSGGIQEETTFLKIPCITLRENTERPITVAEGTNVLADEYTLMDNVNKILANEWKKGKIPRLWDGKTSDRIVEIIKEKLP